MVATGMLNNAQKTAMKAVIRRSLDVTLPQYRKPGTRTSDSYGHDTTQPTSIGTLDCNVKSPTASQLELYAGIIGSQRSVILRVMEEDDIRQGDEVDYDGLRWTLHGMEDAESYTFTKEMLAVVVV